MPLSGSRLIMPTSAQKFREKRRIELKTRLGGKCVDCGTTQDLDFDHIDPKTKTIEISNAIANHKSEIADKELEKCQLLCRSCHIKKTQDIDGLKAEHGSLTMYSHHKCRCDPCRLAWNEHSKLYRREYRKRNATVV